jgi:hypothetical protein
MWKDVAAGPKLWGDETNEAMSAVQLALVRGMGIDICYGDSSGGDGDGTDRRWGRTRSRLHVAYPRFATARGLRRASLPLRSEHTNRVACFGPKQERNSAALKHATGPWIEGCCRAACGAPKCACPVAEIGSSDSDCSRAISVVRCASGIICEDRPGITHRIRAGAYRPTRMRPVTRPSYATHSSRHIRRSGLA